MFSYTALDKFTIMCYNDSYALHSANKFFMFTHTMTRRRKGIDPWYHLRQRSMSDVNGLSA